jgi:hypothetical protein
MWHRQARNFLEEISWNHPLAISGVIFSCTTKFASHV